MASTSGDSWMREYNEAAKLADDINGMISEKTSLAGSGSESQGHFSAVRRKITILDDINGMISEKTSSADSESESQGHFSAVRPKITILETRLDSLETLLAKLPSKHTITEKELIGRKDMLSNLRTKTNQMAATLNMSSFGNRDSLLGPEIKPVDAATRIAGLGNQAVVVLQRQIMKAKDEGLDQLERTVTSTKHIALTVNEELHLHTRLIDILDDHVEAAGSRLQRVKRSLTILNKMTKGGGCTCLWLLVSVVGVIVLILAIFVLIKYL